MRTLAIWFIFWIFIVPSLAGSFLILTFFATAVPPLYFALTWFVLAFSTACYADLLGSFRSRRSLALVPALRSVVVTKQIQLRRKTMKRIARLKSFMSSLVFLCLAGISATAAYAATDAAAR